MVLRVDWYIGSIRPKQLYKSVVRKSSFSLFSNSTGKEMAAMVMSDATSPYREMSLKVQKMKREPDMGSKVFPPTVGQSC